MYREQQNDDTYKVIHVKDNFINMHKKQDEGTVMRVLQQSSYWDPSIVLLCLAYVAGTQGLRLKLVKH